MHVKCPTPRALLFLAIVDTKGVLRFPGEGTQPGFLIDIDREQPVNPQLLEAVQHRLGLEAAGIEIAQDYFDEVIIDGEKVTLYGARTRAAMDLDTPTKTLADILRAHLKDPNRLPYMRALQVFAGAHKDEIRIFTGEEADQMMKSPNYKPD